MTGSRESTVTIQQSVLSAETHSVSFTVIVEAS